MQGVIRNGSVASPRRPWPVAVSLAAVLACFIGVPRADARSGACARVEVEQALASTGVDSNATATARFRSDERCRRNFNVEVEDLAVGDYDLFVGGVRRAVIAIGPTPRGTQGEVEFEGGDDGPVAHPLDFDPLDTLIEVRRAGRLYFADVFDGSATLSSTPTPTRTFAPASPPTRASTAARTATRATPTPIRTATGTSATNRAPAAIGSTSSAAVRVRCEKRAGRSKVSVDGSGLAPGKYRARISSGANQATSGAQPAVAGQAEFDFDSAADDVAAGATRISAAFLQGMPVRVAGEILSSSGAVIARGAANCRTR